MKEELRRSTSILRSSPNINNNDGQPPGIDENVETAYTNSNTQPLLASENLVSSPSLAEEKKKNDNSRLPTSHNVAAGELRIEVKEKNTLDVKQKLLAIGTSSSSSQQYRYISLIAKRIRLTFLVTIVTTLFLTTAILAFDMFRQTVMQADGATLQNIEPGTRQDPGLLGPFIGYKFVVTSKTFVIGGGIAALVKF